MNIAFRTDASLEIGSGHVMRCLTLADFLKRRNASTHFVCRHLPEGLKALIVEKGHGLTLLGDEPDLAMPADLTHAAWLGTSQAQDAAATQAALSNQVWNWVVVDHYALDVRWEQAMRLLGCRILAIDDLADRVHECDVLLDQNLYNDMTTRYLGKVSEACVMLLGPRYALLRNEFRDLHRIAKPRMGPVKRILVFLGGMDVGNYTMPALEALDALALEAHVDVVIGQQHPSRQDIERECVRRGYLCHVQPSDMAQLIAQADLAIGAGGATTWERCCLGLPTLTLSVAYNQQQLVLDASRNGLVYALPDTPELIATLSTHVQVLLDNPGLREHISRSGLDTVDGRGTWRVARALGFNSIAVRTACEQDSADLLAWRNHPIIRSVSRNSDPISAENHARWLDSVLKDDSRMLLIGYRGTQKIGVARFDINGEEAEASIYLVPGMEEYGSGSELLESAEAWLLKYRVGIKRIRAEVLCENIRSHRLFRSSGYAATITRYIKDVQ